MSEIRANTLSDAAGTGPTTLTQQYAAKAYSEINAIGTIAINKSQNVSSLTDTSTGRYEQNLTNSMDSVNYALHVTTNNGSSGTVFGNVAGAGSVSKTASAAKTNSIQADIANYTDIIEMFMTIHGDLA